MQAVVLAGGLGTRMQPRTLDLPKALVPVLGRPFLDWQLERLAACGFSHVLLCVGHLQEKIRQHVGSGDRFALRVSYSHDGPELLGTAGALRKALPELDPTFLVTYGDSYLPFDYAAPVRDLLLHDVALGTMSVFLNSGRWDASNTAVSGELVVRYQKSARDPALVYIDYGALALRRQVVESIPEGTRRGLDELQAELAKSGRLRALHARERFYEVGSEAGLRDLEKRLLSREGRYGFNDT
jgi:NDP-sugar pyrophosphorylase family protein